MFLDAFPFVKAKKKHCEDASHEVDLCLASVHHMSQVSHIQKKIGEPIRFLVFSSKLFVSETHRALSGKAAFQAFLAGKNEPYTKKRGSMTNSAASVVGEAFSIYSRSASSQETLFHSPPHLSSSPPRGNEELPFSFSALTSCSTSSREGAPHAKRSPDDFEEIHGSHAQCKTFNRYFDRKFDSNCNINRKIVRKIFLDSRVSFSATNEMNHKKNVDGDQATARLQEITFGGVDLPKIHAEANDMLKQLRCATHKLESLLSALDSGNTFRSNSVGCGVADGKSSSSLPSSSSKHSRAVNMEATSFDEEVSLLLHSVHHLLVPWTVERYRQMHSPVSVKPSNVDFTADFLLSLVNVLLRIDRFFSSIPRVLLNSYPSPATSVKQQTKQSDSSSSSSPVTSFPNLHVYFRSKKELRNRILEWQSFSTVYITLERVLQACVEREVWWQWERVDNGCTSHYSFLTPHKRPQDSYPSKSVRDHSNSGRQTEDTESVLRSLLSRHGQRIYHSIWKAARACRYQKKAHGETIGCLAFENGIPFPPSMLLPGETDRSSRPQRREQPLPSQGRARKVGQGSRAEQSPLGGWEGMNFSSRELSCFSLEEWCVRWWLQGRLLLNSLWRCGNSADGCPAEEDVDSSCSSCHLPRSFCPSFRNSTSVVCFGPPAHFFPTVLGEHDRRRQIEGGEEPCLAVLPPQCRQMFTLSLSQAATVLSTIIEDSSHPISSHYSAGNSNIGWGGGVKQSTVCSPLCATWFAYAFITSTNSWYHQWIETISRSTEVVPHPTRVSGVSSSTSHASDLVSMFWIKAITLSCRAVNMFPACLHIHEGITNAEGEININGRQCEKEDHEKHGTVSSSPSSSSRPFLSSFLQLILDVIPLVLSNVSSLTGEQVSHLLHTLTMLGFSGECGHYASPFSSTTVLNSSNSNSGMEHSRMMKTKPSINIYALLANRAGQIAESLTIQEMHRVLEAVEKIQAMQALQPHKHHFHEDGRRGRERQKGKSVVEKKPLLHNSASTQMKSSSSETEAVDHTLRYALESVCRIRTLMELRKGSIIK